MSRTKIPATDHRMVSILYESVPDCFWSVTRQVRRIVGDSQGGESPVPTTPVGCFSFHRGAGADLPLCIQAFLRYGHPLEQYDFGGASRHTGNKQVCTLEGVCIAAEFRLDQQGYGLSLGRSYPLFLSVSRSQMRRAPDSPVNPGSLGSGRFLPGTPTL